MNILRNILRKGHSKNETRIGTFWFINGEIVIGRTTEYRGVRRHKLDVTPHTDVWREVKDRLRLPAEQKFNYYPRGRVVPYGKKLKVYLDDQLLDDPKYIGKITDAFNLTSGSFEVETHRQHYNSEVDPEGNKITPKTRHKYEIICPHCMQKYKKFNTSPRNETPEKCKCDNCKELMSGAQVIDRFPEENI